MPKSLRKHYMVRLCALVSNERHLEEELETATLPGHRIYAERSLQRTRSAIDELHHQYVREIKRIAVNERGQ